MAALSSAGLAELQEAAASPLARPSAAQLLPGAQSAEGIPRLERLLVAAAKRAPKELTGAAVDLVRAGAPCCCSSRPGRPRPGAGPAAASLWRWWLRWCTRRPSCTMT